MKGTSGILDAGIIVIAVLGSAAFAIPCFVRSRCSLTPTSSCIANLRQIQGAIKQYALEAKLKPTDRVSITDISGGSNQFIRPLINFGLTCPAGGTYSVTTVGEPPRCSVPGHTIEPTVP